MTGSGDVWATDLVRPVLWHLTPGLVAAGGGIPLALPLAPELTFISSPDNSYGIVALSDQRLVVVRHIDGALYLIELDPQVPNGRTITRIGGVTVPLGEDMILNGNQLVVADNDGLSVVELSPDGRQGRLVQQLRDPSFRETASVALAGEPLPGGKRRVGRAHTRHHLVCAGDLTARSPGNEINNPQKDRPQRPRNHRASSAHLVG